MGVFDTPLNLFLGLVPRPGDKQNSGQDDKLNAISIGKQGGID